MGLENLKSAFSDIVPVNQTDVSSMDSTVDDIVIPSATEAKDGDSLIPFNQTDLSGMDSNQAYIV